MPSIQDIANPIATSEFSGLIDLRPQILDVFVPSLRLQENSRVKIKPSGKEEDLWEFATEHNSNDLDLDIILRYWKNDTALYAIPHILNKNQKDGELWGRKDTPFYANLLQSKTFESKLGYLHISQTSLDKEEKLLTIISSIEEYMTDFGPGYEYYTDLIKTINEAKSEIEKLESIDQLIADVEVKINEAESAKVQAVSARKSAEDTLSKANKALKLLKNNKPKLKLAGPIGMADYEAALALADNAVKTAQTTVNQAREAEKAANEALSKLKKEHQSLKNTKKNSAKLRSQLEAKIKASRNEFTRLYQVNERIELLKSGKYPDKLAIRPKVELLDLGSQSFDLNFELFEGRENLLTEEARYLVVESIGLEKDTTVKLKLNSTEDQSTLIESSLQLDITPEETLSIGQINTANEFYWAKKDIYRGLKVKCNITLNLSVRLRPPKSHKASGKSVSRIFHLLSLQIPPSSIPIPLNEVSANLFLESPNQKEVRIRGKQNTTSTEHPFWFIENFWFVEKPLKIIGGKTIHYAIQSSPPPGKFGKCAHFTHKHAHNYLAMRRGFSGYIDASLESGKDSTMAADGNANDFSYHNKLLSLGYSMIDLGWIKSDEVNSTLSRELAKVGDIPGNVLSYWCDDPFVNAAKGTVSYQRYGHTCINNDGYSPSGWSTDHVNNFGARFTYNGQLKDTVYWRLIIFKVPDI